MDSRSKAALLPRGGAGEVLLTAWQFVAPRIRWCRQQWAGVSRSIGYVAQERGDYARADAAFTNALAAMPEKERCEFQDLSILLDGRAAGQYKHATCQARDSMAVAFWRLVQPLYLTA